MNRLKTMTAVALLSLAAAGCATVAPGPEVPTLTEADIPANPDLGFPRTLVPGDVIEVRVYPNTGDLQSEYRITLGDTLRLDVAEEPTLTRENINVLPDGSVSLPLIGRVEVAGKTANQVSREVSEAYSREGLRNPRAVIAVSQDQRRLRLIYDTFTRQVGTNIFQQRVQEGQSIQLPFIKEISTDQPFEAVRKEIRAEYARVFQGQLEVTANLAQRDVINYYVMGEVQRPGGFPVATGVTPVVALASAGGHLPTAELSQTLLVRFDASGQYKYWVLDMRKALTSPGEPAARFPLRRNDVLFLPRTQIADFNLFIDQYIRRALPIPIGGAFTYEINPN